MKKHVSVLLAIVCVGVIAVYQNCAPVQFAKTLDAAANCADVTCLENINNVGSKPFEGSQDVTIRAPLDKVDILIVDDNSGSMQPDQANLASRFANFITSLAPLDWQIAITTTDVTVKGAHGQFVGPEGSSPSFSPNYVITPMTLNNDMVFSKTVQRTETGDSDERGIMAASLVVDGRTTTAGTFFRANSNFAIIILSDEDERSVGGLDPKDSQFQPIEDVDLPKNFVNKVKAAWGDTKPLIVNSIIIKPGDTACLNTEATATGGGGRGYFGSFYDTLSRLTGGVTGSICDNGAGAFTNTVKNIGGAIQAQAKNIQLDHIPKDMPVVTFDPVGNSVPFTWTPGTGAIILSSLPVVGTKLHITYTYLN